MSNIDKNLKADDTDGTMKDNVNKEETFDVNIDENDANKEENININDEILQDTQGETLENYDDEIEVEDAPYIKKYKEQMEEDKIAYERSILSCRDWELKLKELIKTSTKTFETTKIIVDEFNEKISSLIEEMDSEEKRAIENRQKGINMISRMSQNVLHNIMERELNVDEILFQELNLDKDILNKKEDEINRITNSNYAVISGIQNKRTSLINKYVSFITVNILPIMDGIQSGITFIKNSARKIIKEEIVPVYEKLNKLFDEFLNECNIEKIDIKPKDKIDIRYVEIIDVEYINDKELDETVESIVRNGYEYLEDIYGENHNHILRQTQIIANKIG